MSKTTMKLEQVVKFLLGEDELDSYWFGQNPEGKGNYWWRHPLREAWTAQLADHVSLVEMNKKLNGQIISLLKLNEVIRSRKTQEARIKNSERDQGEPKLRDLSLSVTPYQLALDQGWNLCVRSLLAQAVTAERDAQPAAKQAVDVTAMVNRFLCWRLPEYFRPDAGISFTPPPNPNWWPVGTNLLTKDQAEEMVLYMLGDKLTSEKSGWRPIETAPETTDVLIAQAPSPMVWSAYRVGDAWYMSGDDAHFVIEPTHWMPLPPAPNKEGA